MSLFDLGGGSDAALFGDDRRIDVGVVVFSFTLPPPRLRGVGPGRWGEGKAGPGRRWSLLDHGKDWANARRRRAISVRTQIAPSWSAALSFGNSAQALTARNSTAASM